MYDWQAHVGFVSQLRDGQRVELNPAWSGFVYLQREFGHLFPAMVNSHVGDIVALHNKPVFARQTLRPVGRA